MLRPWLPNRHSVSIVRGELSKERAAAMSSRGRAAEAGQPYAAAACSLVFHSASPMVPTFRADVRHFELEGGDGWYGGGADLTPYYLFDQDASDFHNFYKQVERALCVAVVVGRWRCGLVRSA
jgi:coproporphyrinogen III oxidase